MPDFVLLQIYAIIYHNYSKNHQISTMLQCGIMPFMTLISFQSYKAMHNDAPVYLCELVCPYKPTRTLRSANNNMLEVKRTRNKAGDCSFAITATSLWNNLPTVMKTCANLTIFKRLLKTFLSYCI